MAVGREGGSKEMVIEMELGLHLSDFSEAHDDLVN